MSRASVYSVIVVAAVAFALGIGVGRHWLSRDDGDASTLRTPPVQAVPPETPEAPADVASGRGEGESAKDGRMGEPIDPVARLRRQLEDDRRIDFEAAVVVADGLPAGLERRELIELIAVRWGHAAPRAAIGWAESLTGVERSAAIGRIVTEWAQSDALAALGYVSELPKSDRTLDWVHHIAEIFGERDHAGAIDWALGQGDAALRERALRGATQAWATRDPAAAAEFASSLGHRNDRLGVFESVAHRWVELDPSAALDWAAGLHGEDKARVTRELLHAMASDDPQHAASVYRDLAASLPEGERRDSPAWHIGRELAGRWASNSPAEAGEWAMSLPNEGDLRRAAVEEVTEHWIRSDSRAASEWVAGLPGGAPRDAAASIVAEYTSRVQDHDSAFAWANSIGEGDRQTEMMHHVLERWRDADATAARSAFDRADLSPEQRSHFAELFERGDPEPSPGSDDGG